MSDDAAALLETMIRDNGLEDAAERLSPVIYRLRWGSATLITTISGSSIVVVAPLFDGLPSSRAPLFCQTLLELNTSMGGTASFALQKDGSVVLQVGRGTRGLDAGEFALMLGTVGKFADDFDGRLRREFYED